MHVVSITPSVSFANNQRFTLIAGPCALESREHAFAMAGALKEICTARGISLVYKTSFDKANRTSVSSERGLGLDKSLPILAEVKKHFDIPILTDVHTAEQCAIVAEVVDILQIPAFLCRQTDLLMAAAATNRAINVKKGQFLAPWDMANIVKKLESGGCRRILQCERGVSFGYNTLVSDMRGLAIMAKNKYPVIFDATHSVQQPGGLGEKSGGQREFVPVLARAALAVGVAGLFVETHENPDTAPSDGPNMVRLKQLPELLDSFIAIDSVAKAHPYNLA
jgi:2-dehydro-3-deoxyphosphooctonate aldolase (KDO 8-P synthase)